MHFHSEESFYLAHTTSHDLMSEDVMSSNDIL